MLISTALPQTSAQQTANAAAAQSAFNAAQAAAASRPLTPVAVSAAMPAMGYSPQMITRRSEPQTAPRPSATPQPDRPAILPDPEFWKVPTRLAGEPIAPLPARQQLIEHVQQAVQYTAQAAAQDVPETPQERPQPSHVTRRLNALLAKKPGIGDSTGLGAYQVAAQRSMSMDLPPATETVI